MLVKKLICDWEGEGEGKRDRDSKSKKIVRTLYLKSDSVNSITLALI